MRQDELREEETIRHDKEGKSWQNGNAVSIFMLKYRISLCVSASYEHDDSLRIVITQNGSSQFPTWRIINAIPHLKLSKHQHSTGKVTTTMTINNNNNSNQLPAHGPTGRIRVQCIQEFRIAKHAGV